MSVSGRVQLSSAVVVPASAVRRFQRCRATDEDDDDDDDGADEQGTSRISTASRSAASAAAAAAAAEPDASSTGEAFQRLGVHCKAGRRLARRRNLSHPGNDACCLAHLYRLFHSVRPY